MKIELIDTGYFHADGGAMFGAVPKTVWQRRYAVNEANKCILSMRTLIVTTRDGKIILVDNGAGNKHLEDLSYYNFFHMSDLNDELAKRGISPEQVTDVILTHLHFDHCGYSTRHSPESDKPIVTYPNARYWVGKKQWENFLHPHPLEKDSYFKDDMDAVEKAGLLHLLSREEEICPGIQLRLYDGHTPGQIVPYIRTPERTYIFAGDVIPLMSSLSTAWISAYDTHPLTSYTEKIRLLEEAVLEKQAIIFCHDAYNKCCTVKKGKSYYKNDQVIEL